MKDPGIYTFHLGDVTLQSGATLRDAKLAYKTYGTLNANKSNAIVFPTCYAGQHQDNEWLLGKGMALDPENYFIVVPNMLGNGVSSSPSNTTEPYGRANFPKITLFDNVTLQYRLVRERLGVREVALVAGFSMGAQQAYQWGCLYPDMVRRMAPFCGSAKTSPHNFVFLEGVKAALTNDDAWRGGWYDAPPIRGLRCVGRVYAGWGLSQQFYRQVLWRNLAYQTLEDFLIKFWEGLFLRYDANDLLAMLWTWQHADISANPVFGGDLKQALGAITAKTCVMPSETDLYFPVADNLAEVAQMPNAICQPIPGVWGHLAGGGANPANAQFIDDKLRQLLSSGS